MGLAWDRKMARPGKTNCNAEIVLQGWDGFSSDSLVFCDQKRGCDLLLALKGNCQKHMKKKKTSSESLVFLERFAQITSESLMLLFF